MTATPSSHLRYTLSRWQRLGPHLRIWGPLYTPFAVLLSAFFLVRSLVGLWQLDILAAVFFAGLGAALFLLCRGLFVGLVDIVLVPVRHMDVTLEENALGILLGNERWYLFLDGVTDLRKYREDVWTIQHCNGTVLHVLASSISEEQIENIRAAMERGRTPEGVRAVIERGRRIAEIMQEERKA